MSGQGFVYFIEAGEGGPVKIGVAISVDRRLSAHQISCPMELRLLAHAPGSADDEKLIQAAFAHLHIRGEWFSAAPDLAAFVEVVKRTGELPVRAPQRPTTYADRIIEKCGGTRRAAVLFNLPPSTVQSWKDAGLIPAARQPIVLKLALAGGINLSPADFFDLPMGVAA